jgi:glycosyltransferase involved in cell wall biosynthesis
MKASVIIPYYERLEHLRLTLQALSTQSLSLSDYEIIVVDDGSTHSIETLIPTHIKLIRTPHRGSAAARNTGLKLAQGTIVIFLDSDMIVNSTFVENHCIYHERNFLSVGLGFRQHMNSDGSVQSIDTRSKLLSRYHKKISDLSHPWFMTYTCNVSVPRALVINEFFDENYVSWGLEDSEWAYRLHLRGYKFAFIEHVTAIHLHHDRTMTSEKFQGWKDNLSYTIAKHPSLNVLHCFEDVFDPRKRADYFEKYDKFEGIQ